MNSPPLLVQMKLPKGSAENGGLGPIHTGYVQFRISAVFAYPLIGFFVGTLVCIGFGYASIEAAYNNVTQGVWEELDSDSEVCKWSQPPAQTSDFTLGMPEFATKYTYKMVCGTDFATEENGYDDCRIDNIGEYGCPESPVQWYSYFVNTTVRGRLNEQIDLDARPVICCVDRCPEWTEQWYCAPEHYDDGSICDCECGYPDPDCGPDVTPVGWRGCCHDDYVVFGIDHLIGCLNGTSPGELYQDLCYTDLRCNDIYTIPTVQVMACGFKETRNPKTMPIEVYGLATAEWWMYTSPLMGLGCYIALVVCYFVVVGCCGNHIRSNKTMDEHAHFSRPPRALNLKPKQPMLPFRIIG